MEGSKQKENRLKYFLDALKVKPKKKIKQIKTNQPTIKRESCLIDCT
jgi:hypothetical protein